MISRFNRYLFLCRGPHFLRPTAISYATTSNQSEVSLTKGPSSQVSQENVESAKEVSEKEPDLSEEYKDNHPGLMEFFDDPKNWGESLVRVGRSWKLEELRLKSNSDLHKLWYVLYKEKNMLLTMEEQCLENAYAFPSAERIEKVEESMENLEKIVRERNRAYFQLEVGERATPERGQVFRMDPFGRWGWRPVHEHILPFRIAKSWRTLFGPFYDKDVADFLAKYRERKRNQIYSKILSQHREVRQLLRRFPDTDLEYLQKIYPKVPVNYYKENLDYHNENRHHISQGVFANRIHFRRART